MNVLPSILSRVSCRRQLELNPPFILYLYGLGRSTLTYPSSMQHRWVEPYAQASLGPSVHHRLPQNTNKRTIEKIKNKRILSAPTTLSAHSVYLHGIPPTTASLTCVILVSPLPPDTGEYSVSSRIIKTKFEAKSVLCFWASTKHFKYSVDSLLSRQCSQKFRYS